MPQKKRKIRSDKGKKRASYSGSNTEFMRKVEIGLRNFLKSPF